MKKQKAQKIQKTRARKKNEEDWFVLMGFDRTDKDQQGFLAMNDGKGFASYKITHDVHEALKFPSKNVDSLSSYGTPEQWLKFFSEERELKNWKFHLMKILKPKDRMEKKA